MYTQREILSTILRRDRTRLKNRQLFGGRIFQDSLVRPRVDPFVGLWGRQPGEVSRSSSEASPARGSLVAPGNIVS